MDTGINPQHLTTYCYVCNAPLAGTWVCIDCCEETNGWTMLRHMGLELPLRWRPDQPMCREHQEAVDILRARSLRLAVRAARGEL